MLRFRIDWNITEVNQLLCKKLLCFSYNPGANKRFVSAQLRVKNKNKKQKKIILPTLNDNC